MSGARPRTGNHSSNRTAAVVSRRLRREGFNVSPSARLHKARGVFVSGGLGRTVTVTIDTGSVSTNFNVAQVVAARVLYWPQVEPVASVEPQPDGSYLVRFEYTPVVKP